MVYKISQNACIERGWPPFMQWHRFWHTPSYIEYIALATAVLFNAGNPSAVSRSWQMKAALQILSHHRVPLTFRYSWKRLRNRRSKNLIKFSLVYIAFVLRHVQCFKKMNTYWLNESWKTRLPKRLKSTIVLYWFDFYHFFTHPNLFKPICRSDMDMILNHFCMFVWPNTSNVTWHNF